MKITKNHLSNMFVALLAVTVLSLIVADNLNAEDKTVNTSVKTKSFKKAYESTYYVKGIAYQQSHLKECVITFDIEGKTRKKSLINRTCDSVASTVNVTYFLGNLSNNLNILSVK